MKTCSKCKEEKNLGEFHRKSSAKDGRRSQCKACCLSPEALAQARERAKSRCTVKKAECDKIYREKNFDKISASQKKWYSDNIERERKARREYGRDNKEAAKARSIKFRQSDGGAWASFKSKCAAKGHPVNDTIERFLEAKSVNNCESCGVEFTCSKERGNSSQCVDHCHETGKIRGALCRSCNLAEGFAGGIDGLKKLVKYLEQ